MNKGDKVIVKEKPLPQGVVHLDVDGCCLAVITDRGVEYTANASRFTQR